MTLERTAVKDTQWGGGGGGEGKFTLLAKSSPLILLLS